MLRSDLVVAYSSVVCRQQGIKLMEFIWFVFLEDLRKLNLKEAASALRRLSLYLQEQKFLQQPAGRRLEMYDASSYDRA